MVLRPASGAIEHKRVEDVPELLKGYPIYANDAKAGKFRLTVALPPKGIAVEVILTEQIGLNEWRAFGRVPLGYDASHSLQVTSGPPVRIIDRDTVDASKITLSFEGDLDLDSCGSYPLPPWVDRPKEPVDWGRFEPLYARVPVARARATAGACLSQEFVAALAPQMEYLTLAVSLDSYDPPTEQEFSSRLGHVEEYILRSDPKRNAIAIGSTALRALEAWGESGMRSGSTKLFIAPGHVFRVACGLLTNLHLPMESVLVLVAAMGGYDLVMKAYRQAADMGYVFGDWGDSMLILPD
jgi:S-adenosylmethionine:tRNA ribosyltransferase-isomerase